MTGPSAFLLSLVMICAAALAIGGVRLILVHKERGKGGLMLLAAAVAVANVLVWSF